MIACLLIAAKPAYAIRTVGPSSGCLYSSIQSAINAILKYEKDHPGEDADPYIAVSGGIWHEKLSIDATQNSDPNGALIGISGGWDQGCGGPEAGSATFIDASGKNASVITVRGHSLVYLSTMVLKGGNSNHGGGIDFQGSGMLDLGNIDIQNNTANDGGGIYVNGSGPGLTLLLHPAASIFSNKANNSGGGISAQGLVFLGAAGGNTAIYSNVADGNGGGLAFTGHGTLDLDSVQIAFNSAGDNGGGMYVATDAPMDVNFHEAVSVTNNASQNDGGGIYLARNANLVTLGTQIPTQVVGNMVLSSDKSGGGVFVLGPAKMTFTGKITDNSAGNGGGIAALAGTDSGDDVNVRLKAAGPSLPVEVSRNFAAHAGGGIYIKAYYILGGASYIFANLHASDFMIDANSAPEGTAIYEEHDTGTILGISWGPDVTLDQGAACSPTDRCNEVDWNYRSSGGTTQGSTIWVQPDSDFIFIASGIKVRHNQGAHVLRSVADTGYMTLSTVLIADNQSDGELIFFDTARLRVKDSTIAHNSIGAQHVVRSHFIDLFNSIIAESVTATMDFGDNTGQTGKNIDAVMTNLQDTTMNVGGFILFGDPRFVDAAGGDYHLTSGSLAIDISPIDTNASGNDLDRHTRNVDLPWVANVSGPRDLGAFELQNGDVIFADSFDRRL